MSNYSFKQILNDYCTPENIIKFIVMLASVSGAYLGGFLLLIPRETLPIFDFSSSSGIIAQFLIYLTISATFTRIGTGAAFILVYLYRRRLTHFAILKYVKHRSLEKLKTDFDTAFTSTDESVVKDFENHSSPWVQGIITIFVFMLLFTGFPNLITFLSLLFTIALSGLTFYSASRTNNLPKISVGILSFAILGISATLGHARFLSIDSKHYEIQIDGEAEKFSVIADNDRFLLLHTVKDGSYVAVPADAIEKIRF